MIDGGRRAWQRWRAFAGPFARFVHPAPFVDLTNLADSTDGLARRPAHTLATTVEAATRILTPLPQTAVALLDLPLAATLPVLQGARVAPVPPWIVLVVPRLALPWTTHPARDIRRFAFTTSFKRDPSWWRQDARLPDTRPVWFVLDGDRNAPITDARLRRETDARHKLDLDQLPEPTETLREHGYDSVLILGRLAVPAPDLRPWVDACLNAGMRIQCVVP